MNIEKIRETFEKDLVRCQERYDRLMKHDDSREVVEAIIKFSEEFPGCYYSLFRKVVFDTNLDSLTGWENMLSFVANFFDDSEFTFVECEIKKRAREHSFEVFERAVKPGITWDEYYKPEYILGCATNYDQKLVTKKSLLRRMKEMEERETTRRKRRQECIKKNQSKTNK